MYPLVQLRRLDVSPAAEVMVLPGALIRRQAAKELERSANDCAPTA